MPPALLDTSLLSRILRSASSLLFFAAATATAQLHDAAFGELRRIGLPLPCDSVQVLAPARSGVIVLLASAPRHQTIFRVTLDPDWHVLNLSTHILPHAFDAVTVVERETGGRCVLAFSDRMSRRLASVTSVSGDTLRIVQTFDLPIDPALVVAGDFTNDRRSDLLVADRNTPGVVPLVSNGNGRFTVRRVIAADNAVGAMVVTSLNDDDLADLVLYDWVKSELHMLYGVGGGRLIDQSVFPVDGEFQSVRVMRSRGTEPARLVVTTAVPPALQIWDGTDFGDFSVTNRVPLDATPASVAVADVDRDGRTDVVALLRDGSLQSFLAAETSAVIRAAIVSVPPSVSLQLAASDRLGLPDAIVGGMPEGFWILRNALRPSVLTDSLEMLTGRLPAGVLAADLNRDRNCDVVVVSTGDLSFGTYWGRGRNGLLGAGTFDLGSHPSSVVLHHASDTTVSLLIGSTGESTVSFVTFSFDGTTFSNAVIPTEGRPATLAPFPGVRGVPGFAVVNVLGGEERYSLSFYEKVGGDQYLEQSFRLVSPDSLLGASIANLDKERYPGIIYAYHPADTTVLEVSMARGDSAHVMRHDAILQDLPVRSTGLVRMWVADMDGDDTLDVLVHCSAPANQFFALRGHAKGAFEAPQMVAAGIGLQETADVRIVDLDRDRVNEVIVLDHERSRIAWFHAGPKEDHTVLPLLEKIAPVGYDLGDFNRDGVLDMAVALRGPDVLKLYSGAGRWGRAATARAEGAR